MIAGDGEGSKIDAINNLFKDILSDLKIFTNKELIEVSEYNTNCYYFNYHKEGIVVDQR